LIDNVNIQFRIQIIKYLLSIFIAHEIEIEVQRERERERERENLNEVEGSFQERVAPSFDSTWREQEKPNQNYNVREKDRKVDISVFSYMLDNANIELLELLKTGYGSGNNIYIYI
jgi:thymidylate kinase